MALFEDLFSSGVSAYGLDDQISRVQGLGEDALTASAAIGDAAVAGTEFRPFSVASGTGNVAVGNDGTINAQLSDIQQAIADNAGTASAGLFGQAAQDPASRQSDIFNQLLAGLQPQQERDRLALESRLFSQGRGGITSGQYGGSPEQFAMHKAQEEARMGAFFQAQQAALAEQNQQGQLASLFGQASLRPEAALFNQLNPAIQTANLGQTGQIAGQNLSSQANTTGLEAQINAELVAANLRSGMFGALSNVAGGVGSVIDDWF